MIFNRHFDLVGKHAFLSASTYHWIRYDDDKLEDKFRNSMEAMRGTRLHEFASEAIKLGIKLPRTSQTLNMYVNDAIGFKMTPEVILFYSDNAFGTADAISFKKNKLRIHDLKNGVNKSSMDQLIVYTALFCLEYGIKPGEIEIELRIYQNDEVRILEPELKDVVDVMGIIVRFDNRIQQMKEEAYS